MIMNYELSIICMMSVFFPAVDRSSETLYLNFRHEYILNY